MSIWTSLAGVVELAVEGADVPAGLSALTAAGVPVLRATAHDELHASITLRRADAAFARELFERRGDTVEIRRKIGIYFAFFSLLRRPVLLVGMLAYLVLTLYLPTKVLFIRVEGNSSIPTAQILEQAAACGIYFGADRSEVRSERLKNALLTAMPVLSWAGINTSGCTAVITVRERATAERDEGSGGVSGLYALRDGVILSATVTAGTSLCKPGQAVKAGQLLVSGYSDRGYVICAQAAQGEIYAFTTRERTTIAMQTASEKQSYTSGETKFSLLLGNFRVNLYFGSRNLDTTCDRIYAEYPLTLPGGFVLPVTLVREEYLYYTDSATSVSEQREEEILTAFAAQYLTEQMIAGEILCAQEQLESGEGSATLVGSYACRELISRSQQEEIILPNGQSD